MTSAHLTLMQHAHAALVLALNKIEPDARVRELTEEEESEIVQSVLRAFFAAMGDLPDRSSHRWGWAARNIEEQWRVGLYGNLDTVHDAVLTVNRHTSGNDDRLTAEWVARVYNAAAGVMGLKEMHLTETEIRGSDSVMIELDSRHQKALRDLSAQADMSESAVIRQALRMYQLHQERVKAGETVSWSGDAQRAAQFAGTANPPVQRIEGAVHTVLVEMARRKFVKERPGEAWVHVSPTERDKWVERARDELSSPATTDPDSQLVRQAYIDGAEAMADCVKSLRLHVTLGAEATFEDGMQTMQDAVNSVVDGNLRSVKGLPREDPRDG